MFLKLNADVRYISDNTKLWLSEEHKLLEMVAFWLMKEKIVMFSSLKKSHLRKSFHHECMLVQNQWIHCLMVLKNLLIDPSTYRILKYCLFNALVLQVLKLGKWKSRIWHLKKLHVNWISGMKVKKSSKTWSASWSSP